MAVTIHVNGKSNSLAHKGSMGIAKSTIPDVCKTPTPGGPVPIPYPVIISMSSDLKKGTKTVKVDGKKMAAIKGSEFSRCTGDEPGTVGGVKSSTNMKEATWILYSFDVKLDGKNACRLSDKMMMNHGNTACLGGEQQAPVSGSGWDVDCILDIFCNGDAEDQQVVTKLPLLTVHRRETKQVHFKRYVGGVWIDDGFTSGGSARDTTVWINADSSCEDAAATLFHEVAHTDQPANMPGSQAEYDAYTRTEEWLIKRNMPSHDSSFRRTVGGRQVPDEAAIKRYVDSAYAYNPPTPLGGGAPPPSVMGLASNGTDVRLSDGTTRAPRNNDAFRLPDTGGQILQTIAPNRWNCTPPSPP